MLLGPILGNGWCSVATLVPFSRNLNNIAKKQTKRRTKKEEANKKNRKKSNNP